MNRCPRCGSTKRNTRTLRCVCGEEVVVDGQQPMFDMEKEQDERDGNGGDDSGGGPDEGQAELPLWD